MSSEFWVGADPGGKNSVGLVFLEVSGELTCASISSLDEAVERIVSKGEPLGLGVDAPMWWTLSPVGTREADKIIRERYSIDPATVQSANSLRGAAIVGGAMLDFRIRQKFPRARITRAHPKALLRVLQIDGPGFARRFAIDQSWSNEHERDTAIAAVCAREGFEGRWAIELGLARSRSQLDPRNYWLAPMHYFWPNPL